MRALLLGFLIFGAWAIFARHFYVCNIKGLCEEKKEEVLESAEPTRTKDLTLTHGDSVLLEGYDQFYFKPNLSKPTLNANNDVFLDSLASYLFDNEDKKLKISGNFLDKESEIQVGILGNLGIARAKAIEQLLYDRGIEEERISIDYSMLEDDSLTHPIKYDISDIDNTEYVDVQFDFVDNTILENNFEFDSDIFIPQEAFLFYADSLKSYFSLHPESTLMIIGHTDKLGSDEYNNDLGLRRATSAQQYLVHEIGIENEIKVESKGEKEPMASNETEEGQAKNRRVQFIINQ